VGAGRAWCRRRGSARPGVGWEKQGQWEGTLEQCRSTRPTSGAAPGSQQETELSPVGGSPTTNRDSGGSRKKEMGEGRRARGDPGWKSADRGNGGVERTHVSEGGRDHKEGKARGACKEAPGTAETEHSRRSLGEAPPDEEVGGP